MVSQSLQIIGILNVTPDSYFDGGKFVRIDAAVRQADVMLSDGADIIEVGGESTGPGSTDVSIDEECSRTIPVIEEIRKRFPQANIAIDTYKAEVARVALDAGVLMINDVTAGRWFPPSQGEGVRGRGSDSIFDVIEDSDCQFVLMYSKDHSPRTTIQNTQYEDVVHTVKTFLRERKEAAISAGISPDKIILDPGMGHFVSSDPKYSFEIIARLPELQELGCPLLLSPSRKSFLAGLEELKSLDRLPGTIAASVIAVRNGASYIRTHDVKEVRRGCEIACAIRTSPQ